MDSPLRSNVPPQADHAGLAAPASPPTSSRRRDDFIHFAGDGLDIMDPIPVGLGADLIEHGPKLCAALLVLLQEPQPRPDDFADIVVASALDATPGKLVEFSRQTDVGCQSGLPCQSLT